MSNKPSISGSSLSPNSLINLARVSPPFSVFVATAVRSPSLNLLRRSLCNSKFTDAPGPMEEGRRGETDCSSVSSLFASSVLLVIRVAIFSSGEPLLDSPLEGGTAAEMDVVVVELSVISAGVRIVG